MIKHKFFLYTLALSVAFFWTPEGSLYSQENTLKPESKTNIKNLRKYPERAFQEAHQLFLAGRALKDTSDMHKALIIMGRIYLEQNNLDRAAHYFNHALEMTEKSPSHYCSYMESRYYLGWIAFENNQFQDAMNWWDTGSYSEEVKRCGKLYNRLLVGLAEYHLLIGNFSDVKSHMLKALKLENDLVDEETIVRTRTLLGQAYHWLGVYDSAKYYFHDAIHRGIECEIPYLLPEPMVFLGRTHSYLSEFDDATDYMLKALDYAQQYQRPNAMAIALTHLGILEYIFDNYHRGLEYCLTAMDIFRETGYLSGQALAHEHLAINYIGQKDFKSAEAEALKSLEIRERIGSRFGMSESYENLAVIYRNLGRFEDALEMNRKSLEIRREIGHRQGVSSSLFNLGLTWFIAGDIDQALDYFYQSLDLAKELRSERGRVAILKAISAVYEAQGEMEKALDMYKQHSALKDSVLSKARIRRIEDLKKQSEIRRREKLISDQSRQINIQQISLAGITILLIVGIILAWRLGIATRKIRQSYEELKKRDAIIHTYSNTVIREKEEAEYKLRELEEIQLKLKQIDEQYNWLFHLNLAGIARISPGRKWIQVNRVLAEMLGYHVSELAGFEWEKICHPQDLEVEQELFQNVLDGTIRDYNLEIRLYRKNGSLLKTVMLFRAFQDEQNHLDFGLAVFSDIGYRKFYQNKLLVYQNYLKRFLFLLSEEIESLASGLRNVSLIPDSDRVYQEWKTMNQDILSSLEMIDKVRALQDTLTPQNGEWFVNLRELAQTAALDYPETTIEIHGSGVAFADQSAKFIFDHLIRNAIVHGNADKITIQIRRSKEYVQVMISDNGKGIKEEERFQILDAYLYPDVSKFRGIGLYWVRQYVELYGGGMKIQKRKNKGTDIILLFLSKDNTKVPL
ncbi:MAG: Tetratricopeptide TPR_2 [Marinimicrobia bacterium 46_47]|nr:MAG: Tetratricopeptide TPR_2 [Marinimicrobia bacterium 46_47]